MSARANMPRCSLSLEGIVAEWGTQLEIVTRLTKTGRLIDPPPNKELKTTNKCVSYNHMVMRPLLKRMADDANWELFSLGEAKKRYLASKAS